MEPWKPGQSGNPKGWNSEYTALRRAFRERSPEAAAVIFDSLRSEDERIRLLAADNVMLRAWGKPQERPEDLGDDDLSPAQRKQRVLELLRYAASLQVPEGHEAHALDHEDEAEAEAEAKDG